MKKLCIFDCFGVLVSEIAPVWFANNFDEVTAKHLKEHYFNDADKGGITIDALAQKIAVELNMPGREVLAEWEALATINTELFDYIVDLRKRSSVAVLSNAPENLLEKIFKQHGLYRFFDRVFVSSAYGMIKPSEAFYKMCIESFSETFDKIVVIDDNESNFIEIKNKGIQTITFKSNADLYSKLEAYGI